MGISAQISYWIGRFFMHKKHDHTLDIPDDNAMNRGKNTHVIDAALTMMITRLIFLHFDITNYVAGAKKVNWLGYTIGTAIGIIPDVLIFILAGASFAHNTPKGNRHMTGIHPHGPLLVWSIVILIASLILAKILRDYQKKNIPKT